MDSFFLIYFTFSIFYFMFGVYIISKDRHSTISKMLFILCIDLFLWAIGYCFMFVSPNIYLANFWRLIAALGWSSFFSIWIIIAIIMKNKKETKLNVRRILLAFLPAILFYINSLRYNPSDVLFRINNIWSDIYPVNFVEILYDVYTVTCVIISIRIFYKLAKRSELQREKKQSRIIGITTLITFTFGTLTDIVLPLFQIQFMPLAILAAPISLIGIWYSIKKYELIIITQKYVSEYVYEYIFRNVNDPIFIIGEDFSIIKANNIALESISEITFKTMIEENKNIFLKLIEIGSISNIEIGFNKKNLNLEYELSGQIICDEFNDILGIVIILHNISERKKTEKLLRNYNYQLENEQKRLYSLIDGLPGLVCLRTIEGKIVFANHNFKEIYGEPNNKQCHYIFYNKEQPCNQCCHIRPNSEIEILKQWQCVIKDIIYEVSQQPFQDSDGKQLFLMQMNDITKRELALEEVSRLDRLNLVGELAASIAHEVRNPMTTVRGFLQILKSRDSLHENEEYFDLMISELDRANSILTEFLSIAKTNTKLKTGIKLNSLINSLYPLILADATNQNKQVLLETEEVTELTMNEREIRQLILNLARNGLESMSRGILKIKTYIDTDGIVLAVQDQGSGVSEDILARLGTPFLTTKEGGTGLGLATCFSIAERHNAKIDVESSPSGSTFFVRFKLNPESVSE